MIRARYTPEEIKQAVDKDRERLFAPYATGRGPNWSCDLRTRDVMSLYQWLKEELIRLGCSEDDRRTQEWFFNRWNRSDHDLWVLGAETMNAVLDGTVEQHRRGHHRWG